MQKQGEIVKGDQIITIHPAKSRTFGSFSRAIAFQGL